MKEEMIRIHKAYYKEKNHYLLYCVNVNLYKGETLGIVGGYQSGSKELLEIMSGDKRPTEGFLFLRGKVSAWAERENWPIIHYFKPGYGFASNLTVWENAILLLKKSNFEGGISKHGIFSSIKVKNRLKSLLQEYEVDIDILQNESELTEYQKLVIALICVCSNGTQIIFVENFHQEFSKIELIKLRKLIKHLNCKGITLVLNGFYAGLLADLCDRVAYLSKGQLLCCMDGKYLVRNSMYFIDDEMKKEIYFPIVKFKETEGVKEKKFLYRMNQYEFALGEGEYATLVDTKRTVMNAIFNDSGKWCREDGEILSIEKNEVVMLDGVTLFNIVEGISPGENICLGLYSKIAAQGLINPKVIESVQNRLADWMGEPSIAQRSNCFGLNKMECISIVLFRLVLAKPKVLLYRNLLVCTDIKTRQFILNIFGELRLRGTAICACLGTENFSDFTDRYLIVTERGIPHCLSYQETQKVLQKQIGEAEFL